MKKIILAASLAAIGFAITAFKANPKASAASDFEGVITYSISVDNSQAASMMQGSSVTVYMKGDKIKTIANMGMTNSIVISDRKDPDNPIILLDIMGNKYQLKMDKSKHDADKGPTIKYIDETKQIAGYTCHKAEATITGKDGSSYVSTIYYTEDLPTYAGGSGQFKGLKGCPLEYSMKQQGVDISMSATKVDKQSLTDDVFATPTGYKLMTQEEIREDVQKNMGGGGN